MLIFSLIFTVLGIYNEYNRGKFLDSLIICYVFMGAVAGYWAAKIYKMQGVNFLIN